MKHWDGRDRDDAIVLRPPRRDRRRLSAMLAEPPRPRRTPLQLHSLVGLGLAVGVLAGLAWLLAPASPVSPDLMN